MPLTGAQKTRLRGLGQRLEPSVKIGQGGLTETVVAELFRRLRSEELIKVRLIGYERDDRASLLDEVSEKTHAELVGAVGHTALFYKASVDNKLGLE